MVRETLALVGKHQQLAPQIGVGLTLGEPPELDRPFTQILDEGH
jgi:hypothetical protein